MKLENKVALITGGGRGIGKAVASKWGFEGFSQTLAAELASAIFG